MVLVLLAATFMGMLTATGDIQNNSPPADITSSVADEWFGHNVSCAGDFNNDGYDDLIVGAPGYNTLMGRAYIFFGASSFSGSLTPSNADLTISSNVTGSMFGWDVDGAGDVNDDGFDDVIIGAPGINRAYIVYGSGTLTGNLDITTHVHFPEPGADAGYPVDFTSGLSTSGSTFGYGAGSDGWDWDNNTYGGTDVADHMHNHYNGIGVAAAGRLETYQGSVPVAMGGTNPAASGSMSGAYGIDFYITQQMLDDLTAGGRAKLRFSFIGEDPQGFERYMDERNWVKARITNSTGTFYLGEDLDTYDVLGDNTKELFFYDQGTSVPLMFGPMVYEIDITQYIDGIGEYYLDMGGKIVQCTTNGEYWASMFDNLEVWVDYNVTTLLAPTDITSGRYGWSVAGIGDTDNDGFDDIVVGDPLSVHEGYTNGAAFVYYGDTDVHGLKNITIPGMTLDSKFGSSVDGAGDVNDDGRTDIIVGAPGSDEAFIYYGPGYHAWIDTTTTDFNPGTGSHIEITSASGGEVRLRPFNNSKALSVYYDGTETNIPNARNFTQSSWGPETDIMSKGADDLNWFVIEPGTVRKNEKLFATQDDSTGDLLVRVFQAGDWGNLLEVTGAVNDVNFQGFDVEYETMSGDGMVVYIDRSQDNTRPKYRIFDGSSWGTEGDVADMGIAVDVNWVELARHPFTDEIMLVCLDAANDIHAQVWDGSAWGNVQQLTDQASASDRKCFDVCYEQQTGYGVVVYGGGASSATMNYRRWMGDWNEAAGTLDPADAAVRYVQVAADPNSDFILAANLDNSNDIDVQVWDGLKWDPSVEVTALAVSNSHICFDVAWSAQGVHEGLVVYGEVSDTPRYRLVTGTSIGGELDALDPDGATNGDPEWVILRSDPQTKDIYLHHLGDDGGGAVDMLRSQVWNGTSWGWAAVLASDCQRHNFRRFDIAVTDASGYYDSEVIDTGTYSSWGPVRWTDNVPDGSWLSVWTRSSDDAVTWSPWERVEKNENPISPLARYFQYRVVMNTTDIGNRPYLADITTSTITPDIILTGSAGEAFGLSVAGAGDNDNDMTDDVLVGAPGNNTRQGVAYLFLTTDTSGITLTASSDADNIYKGESAGDRFGQSVAGIPDVTLDGADEVLVGAPAAVTSGKTYIFAGNKVAGNVSATLADGSWTGENTGDQYGHSVSTSGRLLGATSNHGLAVGASLYDDAVNTDSGKVYLNPDISSEPPDHLEYVSGSGQTGGVGTVLSQPIVIKVVNETGAAMAGAQVSFSFEKVPLGSIGHQFTENGATVFINSTDSNGQAFAHVRLGSLIGKYFINASGIGLPGVTGPTFINTTNVTATAGALSYISITPHYIYPNAKWAIQSGASIPYIAMGYDMAGNLNGSWIPNWGTTDGIGTLTPTGGTGLLGYTATYAPGVTLGYDNVTITDSLAIASNTSCVKILPPGSFGIEIVSGNNQIGTVGRQLTEPLVVRVLGNGSLPVGPGITVNFTVTSQSLNGDAALPISISIDATTNNDSLASVILRLDTMAGQNYVNASVAAGIEVQFSAWGVADVLNHIDIVPPEITLRPGHEQVFNATGRDLYNNEVLLTSTEWVTDSGIIVDFNDTSARFKAQGNDKMGGYIRATSMDLSAEAVINIVETNFPPIINGHVEDVEMEEDDPPTAVNLHSFELDIEDTDLDLTWHLEGCNKSLYEVSGQYSSNDILILTPEHNAFGNDLVTLVLEDSDGGRATQPLWINVTPVNDAPVFEKPPDLVVHYDDPYTFDYTPYIWDVESEHIDLELTASPRIDDKYLKDSQYDSEGMKVNYSFPESLNGEDPILVTLGVTDGEKSASTVISIKVSDDRVPKVIKKIPDQELIEGETKLNVFDLDDYFIDPDEDAIFYSFGDTHVNVTIHEDHSVDISSEGEWTGVDTITFRARDPFGALAEDTIKVTVIPVNDPPVISGVPNLVVHYDADYSFDLSWYIEDVDNETDELSLRFLDATTLLDSPYVTTNPVNHLMMTMNYPFALLNTTQKLRISVSDGMDVDFQDIDVRVSDDWPPQLIKPIPDVTFYEDEELFDYFNLHDFFVDPDEDIMFFYSGVKNIAIDIDEDGNVSFATKVENWYGHEDIVLGSRDPEMALTEDIIRVTVFPVNDAPVLAPIPDINMAAGMEKLSLEKYISDVDNQMHELNITVSSNNAKVEVYANGLYIIIFSDDAVETNITVTVTDPEGLSSSQNVMLQIVKTNDDDLLLCWTVIILAFLLLLIMWIIVILLIMRRVGNYKVEMAMLIYRDGRLLFHVTDQQSAEVDPDIFSAMFKVVIDFIEDTFTEDEGKGKQEVKKLEFGKKTIMIEKGADTYLVILVKGRVGTRLSKQMQETQREIEKRYFLSDWDGDVDALAHMEDHFEGLINQIRVEKTHWWKDLLKGRKMTPPEERDDEPDYGPGEFISGTMDVPEGWDDIPPPPEDDDEPDLPDDFEEVPAPPDDEDFDEPELPPDDELPEEEPPEDLPIDEDDPFESDDSSDLSGSSEPDGSPNLSDGDPQDSDPQEEVQDEPQEEEESAQNDEMPDEGDMPDQEEDVPAEDDLDKVAEDDLGIMEDAVPVMMEEFDDDHPPMDDEWGDVDGVQLVVPEGPSLADEVLAEERAIAEMEKKDKEAKKSSGRKGKGKGKGKGRGKKK